MTFLIVSASKSFTVSNNIFADFYNVSLVVLDWFTIALYVWSAAITSCFCLGLFQAGGRVSVAFCYSSKLFIGFLWLHIAFHSVSKLIPVDDCLKFLARSGLHGWLHGWLHGRTFVCCFVVSWSLSWFSYCKRFTKPKYWNGTWFNFTFAVVRWSFPKFSEPY